MNKTGTQRIETHRLILRRFTVDDAQDMYRNWASDPEVTHFLTWPTHTSAEVSRMVLESWIPQYEDGGYFNWAIEWKESGHAIGNISVVKLYDETEAADIGYCLGRAYWGQGIMPEALRAVMDYLFDTVGVQRVAACHDVNNPKSGRVMEKAGMKFEGILRGAGKSNQGIIDDVWHALLAKDRINDLQKRTHVSEVLTDAAFIKADAAGTSQESNPVQVRFAREEDLPQVNRLRKQVNDLHVLGKPEIFKPGFPDELRDYIYAIREDPRKEIVVSESEDRIIGFAVLNHITRPETPFMFERDYLDIDEFCVDEACRRRGVASAMIRFIRDWAKDRGFKRLELNMWEFNREALAFYEAAGFRTYRRYMELPLEC